MADAEEVPEVHNGPSQSKVVLAKPRLGGFGGASSSVADSSKGSGNPFGKVGSSSVLRPPQLKPVLGANPFLRVGADSENNSPTEEPPKDERLKEPAPETTEAPKFVPLGVNTAVRTGNPVPAPTQPASTSSSSGFVFGQNLSERAMVAEGVNNGGTSVDHSSTNGNSELLFASAVASNVENNQQEEGGGTTASGSAGGGGGGGGAGGAGEGLAAAAAEYERSHARPPVLTGAAAPTTTGEEDETNLLQITCRLFAWEAGSWRERGRGVLRLNDCGARGARLVCRVLGSLRVVLNTKVWPEMVADRASAKSLRITATDAQNHVKVFLVMATPSDIVQLHRELSSRISQACCQKSSADTERVAAPAPPPRLHAATSREGEDCLHDDAFDAPPHDRYPYCDNDSDLRPTTDENGLNDPEDSSQDTNRSEDKQEHSLKRKEAELEDDTTPKRQCPEIVIE